MNGIGKAADAALALVAAAVSAAALAADSFVTFQTEGPDRYADGALVMNCERYALVWSPDGVFALAFRPTFKDGATQTPAQWLEAAVAAKLVKVVASPTLSGLYAESAKEIDLGDLKASYDEASGAVTFSLTLAVIQSG